MNLIHLGFWISVGLAVLKLLGVAGIATISWWLVAAPLLVAIGISVALIVVAFVLMLIAAMFS